MSQLLTFVLHQFSLHPSPNYATSPLTKTGEMKLFRIIWMFTSSELQGPLHNHGDLHLLVTFLHPIRDIKLLNYPLKL